jgi:hypothetical protein
MFGIYKSGFTGKLGIERLSYEFEV